MLDDLLRRHDGVITSAQARSVGLSYDAVEARVRSGHWRRCARGVYFVEDRPFTDAARIRSTVLGYGELACASGLAAAWWLDLTQFAPGVVEVTVPRNSHGRCHEGSKVRRRDLQTADVIERRGLRVTSIALTAIEAAVRRGGGPELVDSALRRHIELQKLWAAHMRNKGRYGSPAARRLLQAAEGDARSEAERIFKGLLIKAGITGWKANHMVAGYEVDFYFEDVALVVEIDGMAFHSDAEAFQRDRIKQNVLTLAGNKVFRFTWWDLTGYPDRVLATVKRAIRARYSGVRSE